MNIYGGTAIVHLMLTIFSVFALDLLGVETDVAYNFVTNASSNAVFIYSASFGAIIAGSYIGGLMYEKILPRKITKNINFNEKWRIDEGLIINILMAAILIMLFMCILSGEDLFFRSEYNFDVMPGTFVDLLINSVEQPLGFLPVIINYMLYDKRSTAYKLNKFYLIIVVVYLFGVGTKFSAVVLLLYFVAGDVRNGMVSIWGFVGGVVAMVLFCLIMGQRVDGYYGIFSVMYVLPSFFIHARESLEFMISVFASPVYIAAETYFANPRDWAYFFTELSPFGGVESGWYKISDYLRLNWAIPFSGVGTIYSYGILWPMIYGFFASVIMITFGRILHEIVGVKSNIFVFLLSFLQISIFSQYNLRSATRWLYYVIFLCILLSLMTHMLKKSSINQNLK